MPAKGRNKTTAKRIDERDRVRQYAEMRRDGKRLREIAAHFDVSIQAVHQALQRYIKELPREAVEEAREFELDRLERWHARWSAVADDPDAPPDIALKAAAHLLKLSERRSKLLGLDAPVKTETVSLTFEGETTPAKARDAMAEEFRSFRAIGAKPSE